jgi:TonB family protein
LLGTGWLEESVEQRAPECSQDAGPQFILLETSPQEHRRKRASVGVSAGAQVVALSLFLWFLTIPPGPRELEGVAGLQPVRITLETSPAQIHIRPNLKFPAIARPVERKAELPKPKPKLTVPPVRQPLRAKLRPVPVPTQPAPSAPRRTEVTRAIRPKPKMQTHVGAFNNAPVVAKLKLPASRVQTGGFGNPNGLPARADDSSHPNVERLGSFDQPQGPGSGNGTGGKQGARTLVASAGFGDGGAGPAQGNRSAGGGQIHSAGFGAVEPVTRSSIRPKSPASVARYEPVVITSKPEPVYTAEARRLHIEGDVVLRVVFTASGQVRILSVERGLGHGLDQAASQAAEQIQFKPARRDGQPVDTAATLRIVFQLAS